MDSIELVLAMLLAVLSSGYVVRVLPFSAPLPLVQIAMGALISGVFHHGVLLDPAVFFLLFLPPLLFLDGWRIPKDGLFRDRTLILALAFGLVVFTVIGAGFLIHWMIPGMPLAVAFALAAIVSPTDPVAVSAIAARAPIPKRLMHILEGESLLNDATGLVCFRFAVAAALTGGFSLASATLTFLWLAFAGVAIGVAFTLGATRAQMWLSHRFGEESGTPILVSLLLPFGAYLAAEHLEASGILAAVAAGITMGYVELSGRALATTRIQRAAVWDTIQFTLNGIVLVLLGEQLPKIVVDAVVWTRAAGENPWMLVVYALALNLGLFGLRFAWVWVSLRGSPLRVRRDGDTTPPTHWRLIVATSLAGVRGAITLAGVMTLPLFLPDGAAFPAREQAIFLAASVILLTLLVATLVLPRMLRGLEFPAQATEHEQEDFARLEAARAAVAAVEHAGRGMHLTAPEDADLHVQAAARVIALYHNRTEGIPGGMDAGSLRRADEIERSLRLAALEAQRKTLFSLARHNRISDEIARRLVREIDLIEARYQRY